MVIEHQRRRRGCAGSFHRSRKRHSPFVLTAFAVVAQGLCGVAVAQVSADSLTSAPIAGEPSIPGAGIAATGPTGIARPGNGGAPRDPWRFVPSIEVDETYSDNINLQPAGAERSDLVTSVTPSLRVTRYGPRLTATFDYSPQLLFYARGTNGTQVRNYLDASFDAALIPNFLFFDAQVAIAQTNVSPFGTQAANTVNGNANRAETRTYALGPSLRSRFGNDLSYSAGYRYTGSTANNDAYSTNHTNVVYAQFQSGTSYRNLGYGLDASRSEQSYGRLGSIVEETAGLTPTYVVTSTFQLRGRIGYDRNSYPTTGQPDLKGPSYSGGFDWHPSQHTQLDVQVGHRYFGPSANITLRETTSKIAVTALYSRDQTTSSNSGLGLVADPRYAILDQYFRGTITDPALRAQAVSGVLQQAGLSTSQFTQSAFLSNQLYLQKLAQISVALLGLRNTVTFDASRNESRALSNLQTDFDIFDQAQQFRQTVFDVNWSYRVGPQTTANLFASHSRTEALESSSGSTRQRIVGVSVSRQLQRHLSGTLLVRNTRQTADTPNNGANNGANNNVNTAFGNSFGNFYGGNYRENEVLGSLRLTF